MQFSRSALRVLRRNASLRPFLRLHQGSCVNLGCLEFAGVGIRNFVDASNDLIMPASYQPIDGSLLDKFCFDAVPTDNLTSALITSNTGDSLEGHPLAARCLTAIENEVPIFFKVVGHWSVTDNQQFVATIPQEIHIYWKERHGDKFLPFLISLNGEFIGDAALKEIVSHPKLIAVGHSTSIGGGLDRAVDGVNAEKIFNPLIHIDTQMIATMLSLPQSAKTLVENFSTDIYPDVNIDDMEYESNDSVQVDLYYRMCTYLIGEMNAVRWEGLIAPSPPNQCPPLNGEYYTLLDYTVNDLSKNRMLFQQLSNRPVTISFIDYFNMYGYFESKTKSLYAEKASESQKTSKPHPIREYMLSDTALSKRSDFAEKVTAFYRQYSVSHFGEIKFGYQMLPSFLRPIAPFHRELPVSHSLFFGTERARDIFFCRPTRRFILLQQKDMALTLVGALGGIGEIMEASTLFRRVLDPVLMQSPAYVPLSQLRGQSAPIPLPPVRSGVADDSPLPGTIVNPQTSVAASASSKKKSPHASDVSVSIFKLMTVSAAKLMTYKTPLQILTVGLLARAAGVEKTAADATVSAMLHRFGIGFAPKSLPSREIAEVIERFFEGFLGAMSRAKAALLPRSTAGETIVTATGSILPLEKQSFGNGRNMNGFVPYQEGFHKVAIAKLLPASIVEYQRDLLARLSLNEELKELGVELLILKDGEWLFDAPDDDAAVRKAGEIILRESYKYGNLDLADYALSAIYDGYSWNNCHLLREPAPQVLAVRRYMKKQLGQLSVEESLKVDLTVYSDAALLARAQTNDSDLPLETNSSGADLKSKKSNDVNPEESLYGEDSYEDD